MEKQTFPQEKQRTGIIMTICRVGAGESGIGDQACWTVGREKELGVLIAEVAAARGYFTTENSAQHGPKNALNCPFDRSNSMPAYQPKLSLTPNCNA